MKAVPFESLFKSNKTWLSRIKWGCLLPVWIGFMSYSFYFNDNNNNNNNNNKNMKTNNSEKKWIKRKDITVIN